MLVPWYDIHRTVAELDALSRGLRARRGPATQRATGPRPFARVEETDDAYVLTAVLPGVAPGDIEVQATQDGVHLVAERKVERGEDFRSLRRERAGWTFERTFRLPASVDVGAVTATSLHGELTVHLPKAQAAAPRRIEVK